MNVHKLVNHTTQKKRIEELDKYIAREHLQFNPDQKRTLPGEQGYLGTLEDTRTSKQIVLGNLIHTRELTKKFHKNKIIPSHDLKDYEAARDWPRSENSYDEDVLIQAYHKHVKNTTVQL